MEKKSEKQRYERPVLKRIELRTEEVLSGGCKLQTGSGPATAPCTACSDAGS